jgi:hypothetical protein
VSNIYQTAAVSSWNLRDEDYERRLTGAVLSLSASVGRLAEQVSASSVSREEVSSELGLTLYYLTCLVDTYRMSVNDLLVLEDRSK